MLDFPGFTQLSRSQQESDRTGDRKCKEDASPAEPRNDEASSERRQDRRNAHHEHQKRHEPSGVMPSVKVAYDRAGNYHTGTRTQRLEHAKADQHVDIRCESASYTADGEDRETDINRRFTAEH